MNTSSVLATALLATASLAEAQMSPDMKMPAAAPSSASAAAAVLTDGVVQQIDVAAGTVTLQHGDITNIGMPAMTMAFGVADKTMLDGLKAGDKVKFHVEAVKGALRVTRLQPVRAGS